MKKALFFLYAAATLLTFSMCSKEYKYGTYKMTLSAELISNDSVGNEWEIAYYCDGKKISESSQWLVSLDESQTKVINIIITEKDKIPDSGTGTLTVTLIDNSETKTFITVTEDGGSNQGNNATWEISCRINLIKCT